MPANGPVEVREMEEREVPIFINRKRYMVESGFMTAREILALAGLGEGYDLKLLQGEGDPTGGECILADQKVEIHAGLHFRAVPGNCTFGGPGDGIPEILREHAAELSQQLGCGVKLEQVGAQILVVIEKAGLPAGLHTADRSDVLLIADFQYPMSAMDMFYLEEDVVPHGRPIPDYASTVEEHAGRRWRRWSWHRNGRWTPGIDDLLSHWAFVESCWARELENAPARAAR